MEHRNLIKLWRTLDWLAAARKLVEGIQHGLDLLGGPQLDVVDGRAACRETDDVLDSELDRANQRQNSVEASLEQSRVTLGARTPDQPEPLHDKMSTIPDKWKEQTYEQD